MEWIVLLIPVFSAIVGWATNVVAVRMMFQPVDFVGIKPWFGWQGIVPANSMSLAEKSTELITTKLINLKALFSDFDARGFSENMSGAMDDLVDQIISETVAKYGSAMWENLDDGAREQIRDMVRKEVNEVTVGILSDMGEQIDEILDLKSTVLRVVKKDKRLIGDMFQAVGANEFTFIRRSGAYFGFLFGLVQMGAWVFYPAWWVLPLFGFFVGYVTNYLAIKLIFEPAAPRRYGPLVVHGLFHKRQQEVAAEFARTVSSTVLTPEHMVAKMVHGETGERFFAIVERRIDALIDRYRNHPMAAAVVPEDDWATIRSDILAQVRSELPRPGGFLYVFTSQGVDVKNALFEHMTVLDSESFEGVLRPPFQKDEWKLILAGAVLGLGAGVLQIATVFS